MNWDLSIIKKLRTAGPDICISPLAKILHPEYLSLYGRIRIDPFVLITTKSSAQLNVQICSHAVLSGGAGAHISLGHWTFIGYGSKLFCKSEDYSGESGPVNDFWGQNEVRHGDITFSDYSGIASDVLVMPGVTLPIGCCIGAQSFVYSHKKLEPWSVYAGNPLRLLKRRNAQHVMQLAQSPTYWKQPCAQ